MHVIVVYDVAEERVSQVNKFLRTYLHWIQNSVFKGEISQAKLTKMIEGLKDIMDENYDSITIYVLPSEKYLKKIILGIEKGSTDMIF